MHRESLNYQNLQNMLLKAPKILFLICHGDRESPNEGEFFFCFENVEKPSMLHKFTERDLKNLIENNEFIGVKLAVISACHSGKLG